MMFLDNSQPMKRLAKTAGKTAGPRHLMMTVLLIVRTVTRGRRYRWREVTRRGGLDATGVDASSAGES